VAGEYLSRKKGRMIGEAKITGSIIAMTGRQRGGWILSTEVDLILAPSHDRNNWDYQDIDYV
jgi:hypothetical protein